MLFVFIFEGFDWNCLVDFYMFVKDCKIDCFYLLEVDSNKYS